MDLKELKSDMDERFDRLESKLDKFAESTLRNESDISWIKGAIKLSGTAIIGIITTLISLLFGSK